LDRAKTKETVMALMESNGKSKKKSKDLKKT